MALDIVWRTVKIAGICILCIQAPYRILKENSLVLPWNRIRRLKFWCPIWIRRWWIISERVVFLLQKKWPRWVNFLICVRKILTNIWISGSLGLFTTCNIIVQLKKFEEIFREIWKKFLKYLREIILKKKNGK